jgi:hypothetical protein
MNSSSRQLGQSLGVAITGSLLAASLHGSMHTGFLRASATAWLVLAGCGCAVAVLSLAASSPKRRPERRRTAPRLRPVPGHLLASAPPSNGVGPPDVRTPDNSRDGP